jgi:hypothetical protein
MPAIRFIWSTSPGEASSSPSDYITISPAAVWCKGSVAPYARFYSSMWQVGGTFFTTGEIVGPVMLAFWRDGEELVVGPYPAVRLVGQNLFHGDEMVASVKHERWQADADGRAYEAVVVTDVATTCLPSLS